MGSGLGSFVRPRRTWAPGFTHRKSRAAAAVFLPTFATIAAMVSWLPSATALPDTSLGSLALSSTSFAAGANSVEYSATFKVSSSGKLAATKGTITLSAASGTFDPGGTAMTQFNFVVTDETSDTVNYPAAASIATNGSSAKLTVEQAISDGDSVEVDVYGITNPSATGTNSFSVVTSSDTTAVSTNYSIVAAQSVSSPALTLSSTAAGATDVEYSTTFKASSTGGLAWDDFDLGGSITLSGPAGTFDPGGTAMTPSNFVITDETSEEVYYAQAATISSNGSSATLTVEQAVANGDSVEVDVYGVTNPSATGSESMSISTSSDTKSASTSYGIVAAKSVVSPAISLSSPAVGATDVEYSTTFKASSTGGLAWDDFDLGGSITLSGPAGTFDPGGTAMTPSNFVITDETSDDVDYAQAATISSNGSSATLTVEQAVADGDSVEVDVYGVTNPSATGSESISISTSSDTTAAATSYSIVSANPVSSPAVSLSTAAAGATDVEYSATFKASSTGGLSSYQYDFGGSVTLDAPPGTFDPGGTAMTTANFVITDENSGDVDYAGAAAISSNGSSATLTVDQGVSGGDSVEVDVYGVTNPSTTGSESISISTSSDTTTAATSYSIVSANPVSSPAVTLSSSAADATGVTYTATFQASKSGALVPWTYDYPGSITLSAPSGTVFTSKTSNFEVTDETTGDVDNPGSVTLSNGGATATLTVVQGASAEDDIEVAASKVTNTSVTCGQDLALSTSSDTAADATYTITGAPHAPNGLTATSSDAEVGLSWNAPCDGGSAISGYVVNEYAGASATGTPLATIDTGSTTPSYTATGLTNGDEYTFTIQATNALGTSAASTSTSIVAGLPAAPASPEATAGPGQIGLSWTAPDDDGSAITGYQVNEYAGSSATGTPLATIDTGSTTASYTVTGLTAGQEYTFTVQAMNADGTGPASTSASATVPTAPTAPLKPKATASDQEAKLSWTVPTSDGGEPITGYQVNEYSGSTAKGTPLATIDTGSTTASYTVTGLTNGDEYTFTVQAINTVGTGPASSPVHATPEPTAPTAPLKPKATASNQEAKLSWTVPTSDGGDPITGYEVNEYSGASATGSPLATIDTGSTTASYTVTGLTNGDEYTFTIQAINNVGTGPASSPVHATPEPTAPGAPTSVKAVASSGQVVLTWKSPTSDGGDPITGYEVFRSTTSGSFGDTPIATLGATTLTYTDTGLTNGTTYYYVVVALNTVGPSADSKQVSGAP